MPAGAAATPVRPAPLPEKEPVITAVLEIVNVALLSDITTTMPCALPVRVSASVFRFKTSLPVEPERNSEEAIPVNPDPSPKNDPEKEPENVSFVHPTESSKVVSKSAGIFLAM